MCDGRVSTLARSAFEIESCSKVGGAVKAQWLGLRTKRCCTALAVPLLGPPGPPPGHLSAWNEVDRRTAGDLDRGNVWTTVLP